MKNISIWMFIPIAFLIVILIAIITVQQDCKLKYPFISVAGDSPPASYILTVLMCISAILVLFVAILQFALLKTVAKNQMKILNIICLVLLCLSALGMTILGSVQVSVNRLLHNIGTYIAFGSGLINTWINSVLTFKINIGMHGRIVGIFRTFISVTATIVFILYISYEDIISAKLQWMLVILVIVYIATFAIEFRLYNFKIHVSEIQEELQNTSTQPLSGQEK